MSAAILFYQFLRRQSCLALYIAPPRPPTRPRRRKLKVVPKLQNFVLRHLVLPILTVAGHWNPVRLSSGTPTSTRRQVTATIFFYLFLRRHIRHGSSAPSCFALLTTRFSSGTPTVTNPCGCSSSVTSTITNPYDGSPHFRAILLCTLGAVTCNKPYGGIYDLRSILFLTM